VRCYIIVVEESPISKTIMVLKVLLTHHFLIALGVFLLWSYVIVSKDHVLGCTAAPKIVYDTTLHLFTLFIYMASHALMLQRVQWMNQPTEFTRSKMGNVLISLRRMKLFLIIRAVVISLWLVLVFFENAEETVVPVVVMGIHTVVVLVTAAHIIWSVDRDNVHLVEREKLVLGWLFYFALCIELVVSALWLCFNIVDVVQCHDYYNIY